MSTLTRCSRARQAAALLIPFSALIGCGTDEAARAAVPVIWEPTTALNESLPSGVAVYLGHNESLPLRAWYVRIDESAPDISTRVVISDDSTDNRETVSSFAHDLGACVVVNGGYFRMDQTPSGHVGLLVSGGELLWPATRSVLRDSLSYETARAAIGFTEPGEIQITWATTRNDTVYSWPDPPTHLPGRPAQPLDYDRAQIWQVLDALSAGPALVVDGRIDVTTDQEVFFGTSIPDVHPRTAAGRTRDGSLILMVVDGRQTVSRGVNLEELAAMMLDVGAVDALNLDGGGSSTLVVNGVLLNRPAGGVFQREVMSALATFCD
ncbi:MAG: phosphodiester glycosidase family protein [Gemmatimonadota bacterium]|nr:MAG: phosphodiester glycosidase family protein [Gemmatimonadota bacterium]